ncbi:hypothetical protein [Candidatus Nitrosopumilus sediminis]|uniref:Uncharacterized protein n=1 Tax=Candidatus Nitrosopumilus sediminis TaxID=1229909 RepID=K0B8X7_9ARCH|nr:hypothetical protein [Candidatus Nitrosopumilus sediminis]AFS81909.1 hypothetical protein NSED_00485 [Candidatus Nitrosopumilus sediminis]
MGYSNYYCLSVHVSAIRTILPEQWKAWDKIREARFKLVNMPRNTRYNTRLARYNDQKMWNKLIGKD